MSSITSATSESSLTTNFNLSMPNSGLAISLPLNTTLNFTLDLSFVIKFFARRALNFISPSFIRGLNLNSFNSLPFFDFPLASFCF